jgi:phospholipid/cholesterol/gamma-HCH transport system permease protein
MAHPFPTATDSRPTETFPVVQRTGIRLFRRVTRTYQHVFGGIGKRGFFFRDVVRAIGTEFATYAGETVRQMRGIGVDSLPLTIIVAAFLGGVTAFQSFYQLFAGVEYSVLGLLVRGSIVLELGPLLTALVLTGRVGAKMTAEIGTMRVTEQIDALETLAFDPIAYLAVPRFLGCLLMFPMLTIFANFTAIVMAGITLLVATPVTADEYIIGLRLSFAPFQIIYGLIKATFFGGAVAFVCAYEGYVTGAGAEGVGRSTARAVVFASVAILVLDAIIAAALAPYITG